MVRHAWYLLYLIIVAFSASMSNWLSMWTMLELSSWVMIIITMPNNGIIYDTMFKMFVMLSLSSMMLILLWLCHWMKNEWILAILAFKMGLPPLHWWVGWAMKTMSWKTMWWFTTVHKLVPMIITSMVVSSMLIFWWCVISFIWGSMSFWLSTSYFLILFYSSCIHSSWLWVTVYNLSTFLTYYVIYSVIMLYIFMETKKSEYWTHSTSLAWMMIILLGVPVSMVFFLKFITMAIFINTISLLAWLLMLINILTIFPYTRMVWNLYSNYMYNSNKYQSNSSLYGAHMLVLCQFVLWPCML
uniref:NADH dehydrogenase subunit 2 n=1 Tax=Trichuris sp. GHL-2013 TaxID=1305677 RepID=S4U5B7_9BILA|nr:NADH dehydrogenase subunit 2 [Trichuris sp. GHL-2013]